MRSERTDVRMSVAEGVDTDETEGVAAAGEEMGVVSAGGGRVNSVSADVYSPKSGQGLRVRTRHRGS